MYSLTAYLFTKSHIAECVKSFIWLSTASLVPPALLCLFLTASLAPQRLFLLSPDTISLVVNTLPGQSNYVGPVVNSFSGTSSPVAPVVSRVPGPSNTVALVLIASLPPALLLLLVTASLAPEILLFLLSKSLVPPALILML